MENSEDKTPLVGDAYDADGNFLGRVALARFDPQTEAEILKVWCEFQVKQ